MTHVSENNERKKKEILTGGPDAPGGPGRPISP